MRVLQYNEWKETALTLHLVTQMLGKVKVKRMTPQPEWYHSLLYVTSDGFSTGLIPNGDDSFSISVKIREGKVVTRGIDGRTSSFAFEKDKAICEYYVEFNRMLADVTCETTINTIPQEMSITKPFEECTDKWDYNNNDAVDYFRMGVFAHNAILKFVSPFRCKKMLPSFFWGTFDISSVLFSGVPKPFSGGGIIEQVAFDEQMVEFGFWPGDDSVAAPSFFVLPYPFLTETFSGAQVRPDKAIYSREKNEYFLSLEDVLSYPDPEGTLQQFFSDTFATVTREEGWQNLDWFTRPLPANM